ncbi:unnamed protein product [Malus baccata var. baccata]
MPILPSPLASSSSLLCHLTVVQQMQESIHTVKSSAPLGHGDHADRAWSLAWNPATGVPGIPLSFHFFVSGSVLNGVFMGCRQFWMKRTPEPSDRALGPHLGSYWPLQASMPPLQFGKMLEAITNVLPV